MSKVLVAASTFAHLRNFHKPYLAWFARQGFAVHVLGSGEAGSLPEVSAVHAVSFRKSILSPRNFFQAFRIAALLRRERYDAVFLHTSLAAFFVRLGIRLSLCKPPLVVNVVHGYLFDERTPFAKRGLLLLAEKLMKPVTDTILVMNETDWDIAVRHRLSRGGVERIDGMGVELSRFPPPSPGQRVSLRAGLGLRDGDFALVYAAEFSKRKNQIFLLDAAARLREEGVPVRLFLLGAGAELAPCRERARRLGLATAAAFPGQQASAARWYQAADACASSSRSEGLPFHIMEAMSCGLPVIASDVKGQRELVQPGETGFLYPYNDLDGFCAAVRGFCGDRELAGRMGAAGRAAVQRYGLSEVFPAVTALFSRELARKNIATAQMSRDFPKPERKTLV